MKVIDNADRPVANCILDPEKAYLAGKLVTDDVEVVQRFRAVFPVNPKVTLMIAQQVINEVQEKVEAKSLSNEDISDIAFQKLLPELFNEDEARGWAAIINFNITDAAEYTVSVGEDGVFVTKGPHKEPTATVKMDLETLTGILNFGAMAQSGNINRVEIDDSEFLDEELSDDQLEAVAGGKGGGFNACGAEAAAGQACGADACGAAAGAGTACGAAACGAAACAGDACGAAACAADACVAAACGAAVGAGVCAAAGCGADASVGACAGDLCGAAVGAGVCAGNVCGVDVLGPVDVGPCGVNVVPGIPGI